MRPDTAETQASEKLPHKSEVVKVTHSDAIVIIQESRPLSPIFDTEKEQQIISTTDQGPFNTLIEQDSKVQTHREADESSISKELYVENSD